MKVKILLNLPKTIDGQRIGPFAMGQECELDDATASKFIASAMAVEVLPVEMVGIEALPDGSVTELTGDGSGEALPEIEAVPARRSRNRAE